MSATEYRKLIVIVWLVVLASMVAIWVPRAWGGISWDTDDFMRLIQVRDWLAGQGWSDLTQYRLNPPDGTSMHWSRLPDLPLAAVTLAALPFLPMNDALTLAAMVVPPTYFLIFLVAYALPARLLLGAARSPVALLVAIAGSAMITLFAPGRVDHHGIQLVMLMIALALLVFGLARRRWRRAIALAGVPIGLSVWIGLEMLPMIAAWFAALGLVWCRGGGSHAKYGAIAAGVAALIGVVLLASSVSPEQRWTGACDALSLMPVGALVLISGGFAAMHLAQRWARNLPARLAVAALCGGAAAAIFALGFPGCLAGPYGTLDSEIARWWLANVPEAIPLTQQMRMEPFRALDKLWIPALAFGYCLWRCSRAPGRGRDLWGALAVLVAASTAVIFWQIRAVSAAHVIALLPLAGLVAELWHRLAPSGPRWRRLALLMPVIFVCSAVFWPAIEGAYRLAATVVPSMPGGPTLVTHECTDRNDFPNLSTLPPTVALSYIDVGPMLLFATHHSVLGGPYHRNVTGLKATIELFRSSDDAEIRRRLQELGIGLIATCPGPEDYVVYRTDDRNGLAERLSAGRIPDYLEPVAEPTHPGLRFYRVVP